MIEVCELSKHYVDWERGKFLALDRVSFQVGEGEIFGVLGPNGAGKTTLLRILATVLHPTSGTARIDGFDVVTQAAMVRRRIGYVSTNTAVFDRMTAWETVEYFGRLHGLKPPALHKRMEELFERLNMMEIRDLLCGKMSTGMKQKVSIARALVHDPPVLIFDEATVGLDVLAARAVLQIVSELRDQGKCIIFSTHIMREVEKLCQRLVIINHGRVLASGKLEELRSQFRQDDLEELFFTLVLEHENKMSRQPQHSSV